jgi:hypothetical protein
VLCFRDVPHRWEDRLHAMFSPSGPEDSPDRYASCYLHIEVEGVRTARQKQVPPASITEMLDREFSLPTAVLDVGITPLHVLTTSQ